jgi:hypothetical protein
MNWLLAKEKPALQSLLLEDTLVLHSELASCTAADKLASRRRETSFAEYLLLSSSNKESLLLQNGFLQKWLLAKVIPALQSLLLKDILAFHSELASRR